MRDYNKELVDTEDHLYAYDFDYDVMHPYYIRAMAPFLKSGKSLEMGSFEGHFTKLLRKQVDELECVEASSNAVAVCKSDPQLQDLKFYNDVFEKVSLPYKYKNIVLTHVLEHLDDRVGVMKRVRDEWLDDHGRFVIIVPNANAPSRQLAVRMGLLTHNATITKSEAEHGHRITYSFDTLEREAKEAGLKIVAKKGIFFKALANFQWDKILKTDIVDQAYLDACYELGEVYPDLCSSICLICEK
jgi:2-polyprenyl-3-methyl-5-hydroxy-6-metoxy-1,4-benzoquinol methylase